LNSPSGAAKLTKKVVAYPESCDGDLVHAVVDALDDNEHAVEGALQLGKDFGQVLRVLEQVLQQQLVLGDALHWFQQISAKRQLVIQLLLALSEKEAVLLLGRLPQ